MSHFFTALSPCSAMQGGATAAAARQECVHGANLSSALACLATYLCGRPAHTAAKVDTDREREGSAAAWRSAEGGRGSLGLCSLMRALRTKGRRKGAEWEENIPLLLLLSSFLFFLPGASDRSCGSAVGSRRRRQCLRFSYVKLVLRARSPAPSLSRSLACSEVEQPRRGPLVRPRRLREDGVRAVASRETRRRRRRR